MSELNFGRLIVNRTGRDTGGLGKRRSDPDEQRLYQAPVEGRLAERQRLRDDEEEEDETEASMSAAETDSDQAAQASDDDFED
jgi:hypothetical protein